MERFRRRGRTGSGGGAHNGSGDEKPDIFAFRGILCFLGVSRLDVSLLSIGPLGGRLGSGRCSDWQPPSSCNPRLSVLSNDFAGFALFSGGKHEGIATIGKRLAP